MKNAFVLFLAITAGFFWFSRNSSNNNLEAFPTCAAAKPADQCIPELFREASAKAERLGDSLNIRFTSPIVTFGMGKTSFLIAVRSAVPDLFQRLPSINTISITQYLPSRDARGNDGEARGLSIGFSRANAASVHWDRVLLEDIPRIANSYWEHPNFAS